MHKFSQEIKNLLSFARASKLIIGGVAVLAIGGFLGWNVFFSQAQSAEAAQDCDTNAIIECGFLAGSRDSAVTGFLEDYKADKKGDLEHVFHEYGLSKSELPRLKTDAKLGYVTKDGDVIVDGKVVGSDAKSLGRKNMPGSKTKTINGKTYYERSTEVSFDTDKIPALVLMNDGKVEFVVLSSCGNPVTTTPPKKEEPPKENDELECTALTVKKKSTTEFEFKATSSKTTGDFYGYQYNIYQKKDGKEDFIAKSDVEGDKAMSYTQTKEGDYTVKAAIWTKKDGKFKLLEVANKCKKEFEVTKKETPVTSLAECTKLNATLRKDTRNTFDYTVDAKVTGTAKVLRYTYDYGDGTTETKTSAATSHTYAKDGEFKSKVTVVFELDGKEVSKTSSACEAATPVQPAPPQDFCKPGIPKGDARCDEKTPETPAPTTPTPTPALPATGIETALAGMFGTSALGGAAYYWRTSRRDLIDRIMGR